MIPNRPTLICFLLGAALSCPLLGIAQTPTPADAKPASTTPDSVTAEAEKTDAEPAPDEADTEEAADAEKTVEGSAAPKPESSVDPATSAPSDPPTAPESATPTPDIDHTPDAALEKFRTPFEVLTERAIGRTSRRIRYDWRRSTVQVAATVALPAELNSFDSIRAGGAVRVPYDGLLLEAGFSRVWVADTPSTNRLALTPYRQPGRPDRYELDFSVAYPLAEGIVTAFPAFIPATELVLNAYAHFRYLIYPSAFSGLGTKDTFEAIFAGRLSERELDNLEDHRLPGMELDPGRYGLFVGLGNDLYFQSGLFFSPRVLVAVPLLAFMNDSRLRFYVEAVLSMGVSF